MKLSNLEAVNHLVNIKSKCLRALGQLDEHEQAIRDHGPDSGGHGGYDMGYNSHLSQYDDGSGPSVSLSGCYLGLEMAKATRKILKDQIARIDEDLIELGVE